MLPFEPGAHWTFDNLIDGLCDHALLSNVLPSTRSSCRRRSRVSFFAAFTLAWLVERTDLPWRTAIFTRDPVSAAGAGRRLAFAWTLLFAPNAGWINVALRGMFGLESARARSISSAWAA